jgi:hypothetical protein
LVHFASSGIPEEPDPGLGNSSWNPTQNRSADVRNSCALRQENRGKPAHQRSHASVTYVSLMAFAIGFPYAQFWAPIFRPFIAAARSPFRLPHHPVIDRLLLIHFVGQPYLAR